MKTDNLVVGYYDNLFDRISSEPFEAAIENAVYELYGLTHEGIRIVEEQTS